MNIWYLASVFCHILFAAFWIGGMLFLPLVLLPGIKQHPDRIALLYKTGLKFRFWGWIAVSGLLTTGILNLYFRGIPFTWTFFTQSKYGMLVSWKAGIFLGMLTISSIHDFILGNKALDEMQRKDNIRFRQFARWSGRINLILALIIAFLGVVLSRGAWIG